MQNLLNDSKFMHNKQSMHSAQRKAFMERFERTMAEGKRREAEANQDDAMFEMNLKVKKKEKKKIEVTA